MVEGHCLQAMKIVHHYVSGCFDWLISGQQSVNPWREAISILSGKYKRFRFVHPVFTGSSLDTNSMTFFVLQSPIIVDVREPGLKVSVIQVKTKISSSLSSSRFYAGELYSIFGFMIFFSILCCRAQLNFWFKLVDSEEFRRRA